jgi:hypothetical protein
MACPRKFALHPSYAAVAHVEAAVRGVMDDLEASLGRYCSRSAPAFRKFLAARVDFPVVLTTLPFVCIEQLLFAITQTPRRDIFAPVPQRGGSGGSGPAACQEPSGGGCSCCSLGLLVGSTFDSLMTKLEAKHGARSGEFAELAYAVISKEAVGQRHFLAVYVGPQGSAARLQRGPVTEVPAYRAQRIFQWRPQQASPGCSEGPAFPMLAMTMRLVSRRGRKQKPQKRSAAIALGTRVSLTIDNEDFAPRCVRRAVESFGHRLREVKVRCFLIGDDPAVVPFVTLHIERRACSANPASSSHALVSNYDVVLLKNHPWTNILFHGGPHESDVK